LKSQEQNSYETMAVNSNNKNWQKKLTLRERQIIKFYQLEDQIKATLCQENNQQKNKAKLENDLRILFATKFGENTAQTHTFPTVINQNNQNTTEHEATTGQISLEINQYLQSRGLDLEQVKNLVVSGFCNDVLALLPMEFAVEARRLVQLTLENGFG
jgi:hypothetical protein